MSSTLGKVKFNDGEIMYFEYHCTSDVCIDKLFKTIEEVWDNSYVYDYSKENCEKHEEEIVEIAIDYAGGKYFNGRACRKCNNITFDYQFFSDNYIEFKSWIPSNNNDEKSKDDIEYENGYIHEGYPDWWTETNIKTEGDV